MGKKVPLSKLKPTGVKVLSTPQAYSWRVGASTGDTAAHAVLWVKDGVMLALKLVDWVITIIPIVSDLWASVKAWWTSRKA